jgi:Ca2+-binding EF-hand superfamily protein
MIQSTTYEPEINIDIFDEKDYDYYDDDISQFDDDESSGVPDSNMIQSRFSALANKTASFSQKLRKSVLEPPSFRDELNIDGAVRLEKYFGDEARQDFSRRLNWVSRHKNIDEEDSMMRIRLDQEKTASLAFPFCPVRMDDITDPNEEKCHDSTIVLDEDDYTTASTFDASAVIHDVKDGGRLNSPRTKFISSCVKKKVNPRMSLILRKRVTDELSLQHMGMGDELGVLFAETLQDLPMVRAINLTDNNLTDLSLGPLIKAVTELPEMTSLDLSNNEVNSETAQALALYLHSDVCPLRRLTLKNADVDDNECALFVEALLGNTIIRELNLSRNCIGKSENLNTVRPDLITGGEALGDLLAANSCHLQHLDVSWNMIRMDGASALASSVAGNTFLTYLDVSYNALGKVAGEVLGCALMKNRALKTLHLMNNGLNHTACFAICVAIEENMTLRNVKLDGNPIGEGGGRVLMQIPLMIGSRVKVTAAGCNFLIKDIDSKFDMTAPDGFYELDMQRPYERAIAFKLLKLVASRPAYVFTRFAYLAPGQKPVFPAASAPSKNTTSLAQEAVHSIPMNARSVKLVKVLSQVQLDSFDDQQRETLSALRAVEKSASDVELAQKLFEQYDEDKSGALDRTELYKLLMDVGLRLDMNSFEQAVEMVDVDGSGELEVS